MLSMTDFTKIDIKTLLPQQPPFVMLDAILAFSMDEITTSLTITPDNLFVENGTFLEAGITEHIAQTAAVRMGYIYKYIQKQPVRIGFIGEVKALKLFRLPKIYEKLTTKLVLIKDILGTLLVSASTFSDDELIAQGQMKIAISDIIIQ